MAIARRFAILLARLIFAAAFLMAASFKFMGMADTATYISAAGFPFPLFLAWVAALFELVLALAFLTGAFFSEAAVLAAIYVIFLAFAFHGPSRWAGNQAEFGFFIDHFTFLAGLSSSLPCTGRATGWRCGPALAVRPAGAEAKRLAHTRAARARDHFRGKPCRPAYIPPMDMKAEIERMEAQIERTDRAGSTASAAGR